MLPGFLFLGSEDRPKIAVSQGAASLARSQMRIDASLMKARKLATSLSYRVAVGRHCLILLKNR